MASDIGLGSLEISSKSTRASDFDSLSAADSGTAQLGDREPNALLEGYKNIDWSKIPGFQVPSHSKKDRRSWIWKHGWEIEETSSSAKYWLCEPCFKLKADTVKIKKYLSTSTHNPIKHLRTIHQITEEKDERPGQINPIDWIQNQTPQDQNLINHLIASLKPEQFKVSLMKWIVHDNIAFRKAESKYFREMMLNANPSLDQAGCLPKRNALRDMIVKEFDTYKAVIKKLLQSVNRQIHISFDLWTSGNVLALNGIIAHFLDSSTKLQTFLISLPEVDGRHTGENIAEGVAAIITEFGIQNQLGYFMMDNATNNDACMRALGQEFDFDPDYRRLRCAGHIINLVAKQLIYGTDSKAFEREANEAKDLIDQLKLWRKKGPIGKIHNITVYIMRTSQRREEFYKLQKDELHTMQPDKSIDQQKPYNLVEDVDTRWNSVYSMCDRALQLRNPIDAFIISEESRYKIYLSNVEAKNSRFHSNKRIKPKERPSICDDLLTNDDWVTVTQYLEILAPLKEATLRLEGRANDGKLFVSNL